MLVLSVSCGVLRNNLYYNSFMRLEPANEGRAFPFMSMATPGAWPCHSLPYAAAVAAVLVIFIHHFDDLLFCPAAFFASEVCQWHHRDNRKLSAIGFESIQHKLQAAEEVDIFLAKCSLCDVYVRVNCCGIERHAVIPCLLQVVRIAALLWQ